MNTIQNIPITTCQSCATAVQRNSLYCGKCQGSLYDTPIVSSKRMGQTRNKKTVEDQSLWPVVLPAFVVVIPLFFFGGQSLIISLPIVLYYFFSEHNK